MKKLVIAAAIAAMTATVQAQDYKVYGTIDAGEYHINNKNSMNYTGFGSKIATTSRFGIQATEDIGNGLKAGFNLETELSLTDGVIGSTGTGTATGAFHRAANVYLDSKDLGRLNLGRVSAPVWTAAATTGDALGMNSLGFVNAVIASHGNANKITGETRAHPDGTAGSTTGTYPTTPGLFNAGVMYTSPKLANFSLQAFTTPNSGAQGATLNENGQRDVVVSYNDTSLNVAVGTSKTYKSTGEDFATKNLYAANYTIGALKVTGGLYQTRYASYHDIDVKTFGARYQATPKVSFGASWTLSEDKTTTANKNTTIGAAGYYDFSKRTQAYGLVGSSKNEGAAKVSAIFGGPSVAAASEGMVYAVGVKHSF